MRLGVITIKEINMMHEKGLTLAVWVQQLVLMVFLSLIVVTGPIDCYYNATRYKQLVLHDHTNDDAVNMLPPELVVRSGFRYREFYAVADDGYITHIMNLINPKADRRLLKRPPVIMLHGSHVDSSIYLFAHSIQHHPEPWPREPSDGPITSSNRSLAFTLANHGYDVWLVGVRGSNKFNGAWTSRAKFYQAQQPNFKPDKLMSMAWWSPWYWQHNMDDLIEKELPNQINLIRNVTGIREYHLFTYSLSTMSTMAFLGENPQIAKFCRSYTQMAPVVVANHFTYLGKVQWEWITPRLPGRGIGFTPSLIFDDVIVKNVLKYLSFSDQSRYKVLHNMFRPLFGPSPIYTTNLERNVIYHLSQPVSFRTCQQYTQSSMHGKFRFYDYGALMNLFRYNNTTPPEHKIDRLEVQKYLIISGSLDTLGDSITVQRMNELTWTPTPISQIIAPGFNHMDLIAGTENDVYVNLPYVEFLDKHSESADIELAKSPVHNMTRARAVTLNALIGTPSPVHNLNLGP